MRFSRRDALLHFERPSSCSSSAAASPEPVTKWREPFSFTHCKCSSARLRDRR